MTKFSVQNELKKKIIKLKLGVRSSGDDVLRQEL